MANERSSWELGRSVSDSFKWTEFSSTHPYPEAIPVSRREASTLGEEEDSGEALVRRHRTYPKHQPHVYEPVKASWRCV